MNWVHPITLWLGALVLVFAECRLAGVSQGVGARPDLLPSLVIYAALNTSLSTTTATAVIAGLAADALSLGTFGLSVLPLSLLGIGLHARRDLLLKDSAWAQALLGGLAAPAVNVVSIGVVFLAWPLIAGPGVRTPVYPEVGQGLLEPPRLGATWAWQLLVLGGVGALATPLVFRMFQWIEGRVSYRPAPRPGFRTDREIKRGRR